jgi:DNA replication and repair protein RecF
VLAVGPNGAGKTNLLESLHVATQGFSPRTRADAQLIRFGEDAARIQVRGRRNGTPLELDLVLRNGSGKEARLNGSRLRSAEQLRNEVATLVFTPDRLAVVKGGPAARRAYFDRVLGRLFPSRAALPTEYGSAVGQRNAALRRVAAGVSSREAVSPWTSQVAELGTQLVEARREALAALSPALGEVAAELGLPDVVLAYEAQAPFLDEIGIFAGERELRSFGSQGEQRLAVLALLLAEASLIRERRGTPPLLLLDDVLSELDSDRRRVLVRLLAGGGQTLVTATSAGALPAEPDQLLEVSPGEVRVR